MDELNFEGGWFGLKPPPGVAVQAAWGCRAILAGHGRDQYIDIVADRKQAAPHTVPPAFVKWLNGRFSKWLRNKCGNRAIEPGSADTYTLDDGVFHAIACPNRSYGYLYVGAWMTKGKSPQIQKDAHSPLQVR